AVARQLREHYGVQRHEIQPEIRSGVGRRGRRRSRSVGPPSYNPTDVMRIASTTGSAPRPIATLVISLPPAYSYADRMWHAARESNASLRPLGAASAERG